MTHTLRGILALLLVTLVWGTTFPAMKALTLHFSAQWIIFIRFAIAFRRAARQLQGKWTSDHRALIPHHSAAAPPG